MAGMGGKRSLKQKSGFSSAKDHATVISSPFSASSTRQPLRNDLDLRPLGAKVSAPLVAPLDRTNPHDPSSWDP